MRPTVWLGLGILVLAPTVAAGVDPYGTRQSAGIFVTVDGRVNTIYLDFAAAEFREGRTPEIPVTLTSDLDLWVEGHRLAAGRHELTFLPGDGSQWTIGEPVGGMRGEGEPKRFLFAMRQTATKSPWLTGSFSPDSVGDSVILDLRFGTREGALALALREGAESELAVPTLDIVELRGLRDRLREVAGALETGRARHHVWSVFFQELGEAMIAEAGEGWITGLTITRDQETVALSVSGRVSGGRQGVDGVGRRLGAGELGRLFARVAPPIARVLVDENAWTFTIQAESPLGDFEKSVPVAALSQGKDATQLSEEILLLEERLEFVSGDARKGFAAFQDLLLAAKRESGALLSAISAEEPKSGAEGLWSQAVRLTAAGAAPTLILFLRELEDCRVPIRILPRVMKAGEFGPELELEITFLGYASLSEREPRLLASVRAVGQSPQFQSKRQIYVRGLSPGPGSPYTLPEWKRDPFSPPVEPR